MVEWDAGHRPQGTPSPGSQLRLTDVDGHRVTSFATNTARGQLADLELRHRRRARAEDRIRTAKDTGLRNFPLHDGNQNQMWCAIVALACELTTWMQLLGEVVGCSRPSRRGSGPGSLAGAAGLVGHSEHEQADRELTGD
jgi:hypothetical protein